MWESRLRCIINSVSGIGGTFASAFPYHVPARSPAQRPASAMPRGAQGRLARPHALRHRHEAPERPVARGAGSKPSEGRSTIDSEATGGRRSEKGRPLD
jgi:hypothetical protein